MKNAIGIAAATALTGTVLAGCSARSTPTASTTPPASPSATSAAKPADSTTPAEPQTAAAAKAAAETYFGLYAAEQYAAVYPLIASSARRDIRERVWVGLHNRCRPTTAPLSYKVTHPILAGTTAVVTVGYAGAAASLGSEQITLTYTDGKWYYLPSDLGIYRHHNLTQAVAAAKANNLC